jgi:hypothetical protein
MKTWVKSEPELPLFDAIAETRFAEYHEANPEVYEWFKKFAFEKIRRGATHIGAKAIFERIRWESPVNAAGDPFKINNIFTPYFARKFMQDFQQHAGIFETRRAKADLERV